MQMIVIIPTAERGGTRQSSGPPTAATAPVSISPTGASGDSNQSPLTFKRNEMEKEDEE
jgi:hypothetical protein